MNNKEKILEIKGLKKYYKLGRKHIIKAIDGIDIDVYKGEIIGVVGESGSGKSTLGRSILNINSVTDGKIIFNSIDITDKKQYRKNRDSITSDIQIIFQDSTSCLNQRRSIYEIISEPIRIKKNYKSKKEILDYVIKCAKDVGLSEEDLQKYPAEISGGQRQRVSIARALTLRPKLIVADEPIASLDVSMQAQIVNLFKHLKNDHGITCVFIAHDLSMVRYISDRIAVMYKGKIVELGNTKEVYENPIHPYTKVLIASRLNTNPKYKNLALIGNYNEEDEEFCFANSQLIEVNKNHFVSKNIYFNQ